MVNTQPLNRFLGKNQSYSGDGVFLFDTHGTLSRVSENNNETPIAVSVEYANFIISKLIPAKHICGLFRQ